MSTGSIIGGVVGAAIGFMIGGPVGAAWGAGIGFSVGLVVDPVTPDIPAPGSPNMSELQFNTANEGAVIPDILGTPKLNGNVIWAGNSRVEEIQKKVEGGKGGGGGQKVTEGYRYYLSWAIVFCLGPIDKLYTIYANDDVVWYGELERPATGGMVSLTLDNMGAADFYFGTSDQDPSAYLEEQLDDPALNVPYRGQCWMLLKDCYIGNYNRAPTIRIVAQKSPEVPGADHALKTIETYDYNPAYAVYHVLVTMAGWDKQYIDVESLEEAARILAGEARGISIAFASANSTQTYLEAILRHIDGVMRWGGDGKFKLALLRKTSDVSSLPVVDSDAMVAEPQMERKSWAETYNEMKVQFTQRFFRSAECPSGCDGIEEYNITPISIMAPSTAYTFRIQNPAWTELEQNCTDLSFLNDGLPAAQSGTFKNLQKAQDGLKGTWEFEYETSAGLCSEGLDCPTICGIQYDCCGCEVVTPVQWNWDDSATTITIGATRVVYVDKGKAPFTWEIEENGYILGQEITTAPSNTVRALSGSCGPCTIKVIDACGNECEGHLRNTSSGTWGADLWWTSGECIIKGQGTLLHDYGTSGKEYELYLGKYNQVAWMYNPGACTCQNGWPDCEGGCSYWCDGYGYCLSDPLGCDVCLEPDDPDLTPPGYEYDNSGTNWFRAACNRDLRWRDWRCL